jgi:hypothetical protein
MELRPHLPNQLSPSAQYKFVVDGQWRTSPVDAVIPDGKVLTYMCRSPCIMHPVRAHQPLALPVATSRCPARCCSHCYQRPAAAQQMSQWTDIHRVMLYVMLCSIVYTAYILYYMQVYSLHIFHLIMEDMIIGI